jgi:uncharacterized protein (DUF1919 family)
VYKSKSMSGINYQASDTTKKLSGYQTKLSQIYVRIFHQSTKTEISEKWSKRKKYTTSLFFFFLFNKKNLKNKNK